MSKKCTEKIDQHKKVKSLKADQLLNKLSLQIRLIFIKHTIS